MEVYAAAPECIEGIGPLGLFCEKVAGQSGEEAGTTVLAEIANIVSRIIGIVTIVAFLWFLLQFITAAFGWLNSGGDPAKLEGARNRILNAGLGLLMVVGTLAVMGLVQTFFGIKFLDLASFAPDLLP